RERSKRHIAGNYLSGKEPIKEGHDIILFRFVVYKDGDKLHVCKVLSIEVNGSPVISAASTDVNTVCRLVYLEKCGPESLNSH
uniref:hypothetical protein n=1 Tax=Acinetobacter baumannii TaxID=470 RepID=UPI001C07E20D